MFDLAWSEILLVGIVALLVVGPKELPDLLRTVGRWVRKARSMASNFQSTFDQMMRDEEMAKTRQELERAMSGDPALPKPSYASNPRPQPEEEEDWYGDEVADAVADVTKDTDAAAKAAEAKAPAEAEKPPAGSTGA
ncbi:Sec-independent protein translocase protein TatB [Zavarzinia aquatilis]|uniref:Sec-independent protein translocase protein TatB n=1 Tax=Zavarzinia aquatilis TaxID=2211142 RepID=A0A317EFD4_9PROT|nr:Sec-independent protein translocase protein TatB [Zavarzinia aquatilis]PWR24850.1 twin-arginine translocase subunit TatB [Zavarzinia aquatilis]